MSCNGFNHPSDCMCDFRGGHSNFFGNLYTASRGSTLGPSRPSAELWASRDATYDSFVNPNATCPLCGASVYYYQSPYGGRVYFDDLGSPWPKHPCTDNIIKNSSYYIHFPSSHCPQRPSRNFENEGWKPLVQASTELVARYKVVRGKCAYTREARHFVLKDNPDIELDGPIFYRRNPLQRDQVELSFPVLQETDVSERRVKGFLIPECLQRSWYTSFRKDESYLITSLYGYFDLGVAGDAETQLLLGSFYGNIENERMSKIPSVFQSAFAIIWLDRSAHLGNPSAYNILGVMLRDGTGLALNPLKALGAFRKAAAKNHRGALHNLAECYREGIGTTQNKRLAERLEKLAKRAAD